MGNGDIDFMQNADGVAFDAMGEGLVVSSPFSDDAAEVKNWEEKAEETNAPETSKEVTGDGLADYFMTEFLKGDEEGDGDDEPSLGRGVTLDKEQSPEGEDYSVGRWVAFPNARMSGKVRQIVDHAPSDCGFMAYWLTSPELDPSNRFKTVGMKLNGYKSFGTKEEAEKYLQEEEGEVRKKILQIVTKDSLTDATIFDPERFDQNSFEWGAIYWINQIRDAVEEFEDGYVVPDEQFIEMLRPLKKAAKVYAEAHGKDKAWVKNTVLSVPKAFANAFDTLSDGEGVSKEHFLKVLTVEGVCALAEGDIDSVHELENYYYRKGRYSPKGGYEVGRFVVIIKDPPSPKYESERIRRIIAISGEKGDDDPTLVFWNASKSGIVERKASQCSKPFHKCDDAYDWWFVENGDGARPLKKAPVPEKDGGLSSARDILKLGGDMNAIAADAIEDVFGIGQDALDPNDADFWEKHDKAKHGGHFDPETMTCKLREKYEQGEKIENLKDEMDDIEGEDPDVGASGNAGSGNLASRQGGDLNSDPDYGIISDILKAEKDRQNGRPAQFHQRVPEEALRGGDEGTRILREASLVCRATEGTGSQGEGNSGGGDGRGEGAAEGAVSGVEQAREASRRQEAILEKYAKKLGIWEDDAATALKERDDYDYIEGGETIAFFPDDVNKPLTKVITSAYFPETVQLLDRIMLHNYLFPYSKLDVKGFGRARPDWLTDGDPMFCVKVEQQAVDTSCPAKPEQIEEYMKNLGFHKHRELAGGDVVWESNDGKYVVSDLTDENVFLTQDGHIAVIDANIQLNTPGSDGSGKYKIPSFKNQESDLQKGTQDMGIVQDAQVGAVAQQQPNGQAAAKPPMPELDFAGLNKFLQEQGQSAGAQPQQPAQQAQQPQAENPDTGAEQDGFANIKDGDTFTDENGQQWQYTVMNFNVVPEDTKDEMVDDLSATDEGEGEVQPQEQGDESTAENDEESTASTAEDDASDAGLATGEDSALDILMSACDEVIGDSAVAQDGAYNTGKPLTMKRQREGWDTNDPSEIAAYHWKRKNVSKNADGSYHVGHYGTEANLKARENARRTHRQAVAATWEDCKAKDKYKCRWHGAAFMRDNFGQILQANGLPVGNFDVRIDNPEKIKSLGKNEPIPYRLIFATPVGTPPEVRMKCAREFFLKHPGLVYELPKGQSVGDLSFKVKDPEDADDIPIDAPTQGDIRDRQDTQSEASWNERANARAAVSYAGRDTLDPSTFFDMLSEHPSNIVELNEDMLRYLHSFPDCVPEGMTAEDVREVYDRFKKADAAKKGVQSYILNGEVRDRAEFLAEAAEQGLKKEAKAYYTAAQDVYDLAADIFNNVQQQLQDSYEEIHAAVRAMPSGKMVDGSTSGFKNTVYFGNGFSVKGKKFPIRISGEEGEVLKECMEDYAKSYRIASALTDKIMEGCEKREPLLVAQGIAAARKHLQELQFSAETLGELQDTIIENMSEQRRKKNGISLPSEKGKKSNAEASTPEAPAKEQPQKAEEPVAEVKEETKVETSPEGTAENTEVVEEKKATTGKLLKKKDLEERAKKSAATATESGMSAEGSTAAPANGTAPQLSAEALEQIKAAAMKDKNIRALDKARTKMFQTFGADSEQYKTADKKAVAALNAFFQKKVAEMNANAPANPAASPADPTAKKPVEQQAKAKPKKDKKVDAAQPAQTQEPVVKTEEPKKEEPQQQTQEPEPVTQEPSPVQKPIVPRSKKPQSSVVKMAKGEQQTATAAPAAKKNEQAVEASGAGLDIVRGMKISDKPTLEEAKAMNEQFAALEKRLRGLTQVYASKTSDSKDWKAAEAELKAIKSEIDGLMQKARGKGYQWTKDSPRFGMEGPSDRRPLDIPTNFHLSGIKDESGKTVSVPYKPPKAGEMDIPASTDTQSEEGGESTKKAAKKQPKTFKKKADYSADFDAIDEKVGVIGQGPYKEKSITDLISDGYEVKPITTNGQLEYYFGLPDDNSTYGIRISKEQPPLRLSNLFEKRMGGNLKDEQAFHDFVEALRWKIKDYKDFF